MRYGDPATLLPSTGSGIGLAAAGTAHMSGNMQAVIIFLMMAFLLAMIALFHQFVQRHRSQWRHNGLEG